MLEAIAVITVSRTFLTHTLSPFGPTARLKVAYVKVVNDCLLLHIGHLILSIAANRKR